MRSFLLASTLPLLFAVFAAADEKPKDEAPRSNSPLLLQASAKLADGTVLVRIDSPIEQGVGPLVHRDGIGSLPPYAIMRWLERRTLTLGKTVQAYRTDGKPADAEAVLKALTKPKGVAVFVRSRKDDPAKPDPFYLSLLRQDTLALMVEEKDWSPSEP